VWLFRGALFRPFGPVGLAFAAYRGWRRLPVERKQEIKRRARALVARINELRADAKTPDRRRIHGQES
jgi:hypothetical protein